MECVANVLLMCCCALSVQVSFTSVLGLFYPCTRSLLPCTRSLLPLYWVSFTPVLGRCVTATLLCAFRRLCRHLIYGSDVLLTRC